MGLIWDLALKIIVAFIVFLVLMFVLTSIPCVVLAGIGLLILILYMQAQEEAVKNDD